MMKSLVRDLVALAGVGCLAGGLYLSYGAGVALTVLGGLLVATAAASAWRKGA